MRITVLDKLNLLTAYRKDTLYNNGGSLLEDELRVVKAFCPMVHIVVDAYQHELRETLSGSVEQLFSIRVISKSVFTMDESVNELKIVK